jgi:acetyl-CoA carboxylase biotin carboxyl carrier protein
VAEVRAEMVANVWKVVASEGDHVDDGDTLVILESMKMEIPVLAENSGTITKMHVAEGDVVQEDDLIATIDLQLLHLAQDVSLGRTPHGDHDHACRLAYVSPAAEMRAVPGDRVPPGWEADRVGPACADRDLKADVGAAHDHRPIPRAWQPRRRAADAVQMTRHRSVSWRYPRARRRQY